MVCGAFLSSRRGNLAGRTGLPILRHSFGFHLEAVFGSNSGLYSPVIFRVFLPNVIVFRPRAVHKRVIAHWRTLRQTRN